MTANPSQMSLGLQMPNPAKNRMPKWHKAALDTERIAAALVYPHSGTQRMKVLKELERAGAEGRTDYELGEALGILRTSAGKRRAELAEDGLVQATVNRRMTDTSSPAVVWRLTEKGRQIASLLCNLKST